jgi:hypothetical protein
LTGCCDRPLSNENGFKGKLAKPNTSSKLWAEALRAFPALPKPTVRAIAKPEINCCLSCRFILPTPQLNMFFLLLFRDMWVSNYLCTNLIPF